MPDDPALYCDLTDVAIPYDSDADVTYEPFTDRGCLGYRARLADGRSEYVYLSPSEGSDDGVPTVFLYQGLVGDPAQDEPIVHVIPGAVDDVPRPLRSPEFRLRALREQRPLEAVYVNRELVEVGRLPVLSIEWVGPTTATMEHVPHGDTVGAWEAQVLHPTAGVMSAHDVISLDGQSVDVSRFANKGE